MPGLLSCLPVALERALPLQTCMHLVANVFMSMLKGISRSCGYALVIRKQAHLVLKKQGTTLHRSLAFLMYLWTLNKQASLSDTAIHIIIFLLLVSV